MHLKVSSANGGHFVQALIHCGLVMPYDDIELVNIGSGNGLVPDGTKPLSEPMLTYHQWCCLAFAREVLMN